MLLLYLSFLRLSNSLLIEILQSFAYNFLIFVLYARRAIRFRSILFRVWSFGFFVNIVNILYYHAISGRGIREWGLTLQIDASIDLLLNHRFWQVRPGLMPWSWGLNQYVNHNSFWLTTWTKMYVLRKIKKTSGSRNGFIRTRLGPVCTRQHSVHAHAK